MAKYNVGDRVRIVSNKPNDSAFTEEMEKYLGKTLTVRRVDKSVFGETHYFFEEAKPDDPLSLRAFKILNIPGFFFKEEWISGPDSGKRAINDTDSGYRVVIRWDGKKTTATLMHGERAVKTAEAKCNPADTFQYGEGAKVAIDRLLEKKKAEKKPKNPKRGDRFVVIGNNPKKHHFFNIGEIVWFNSGPYTDGSSDYVSEKRRTLHQSLLPSDVKPVRK